MKLSKRAEELFVKAQTLSPDTRAQFVGEQCGTDYALLEEVNSLLAASDQSESYFERLSGNIGLPALAEKEHALPANKVIGQWRLLELIGRGGMGSVYLAERADEQFEKRAALKILPFGLDGAEARSRFVLERQILARLVHDNIARLLDGGVTDDGIPYFVMDYVDGLPIDEYCQQRKLSLDARLRLVLDVADAVQFAHRNLVVHRDLKPGNVLVEADGRVRLMDFGIAKELAPGAEQHVTQLAQRPATPAFASPEMLSGESVDVTTDVYSIGVLAYLLLTDRLPLTFDGLRSGEVQDHVKNADVPPASVLNPQISTDLDAILTKALAKEPSERYSSVEGLASDFRRYLDGMPVSVKSPSNWYRARKFVARHRVGAAFAGFVAVALSVITLLAVQSAIRSDRQAEAIALERDRAEQTKEFLVEVFSSANPNTDASKSTALELLDAGRKRIAKELDGQPEVQADLLHVMSEVYETTRSVEQWREVLHAEQDLREQFAGTENLKYAQVLVGLSRVEDIAGDYEKSLAYASQALALGRRLNDPIAEGIGHVRVGRVLDRTGDYEGAETSLRNGLEMYQTEYGDNHLDTAQVKLHLGGLMTRQQRWEEALVLLQEALNTREQFIQGDNTKFHEIFVSLASVLNRLKRHDEAVEIYERAFAMNDRMFGPDNSYNEYVVNGLGVVAEHRKDYKKAAEHYEHAVRLGRLHGGENADLGIAVANLGKVLTLDGRYDLALPVYEDAVDILERSIPDHWILGDVRWRYGRCLLEAGDLAAAEVHIVQGLDKLIDQWGLDHVGVKQGIAVAQLLYEKLGQPEKAEKYR